MLDFLINSAFAAEASEAAAKQPSLLASLAPMALIMAVFYFLIIRPQSKRANEHRSTLSSIKKGDQVITAGGIYGSVIKVEENKNICHIEIADNVKIKVKQDTILEVIRDTPAAATA